MQVQLRPDADAGTRVVFRIHGVQDDVATQAAKRLIVKDIEVCDVSFAGNRNTIGTFPADDVADWTVDPETGEKYQRLYKEKYAAQYQAFKAGSHTSLSGTPLEALNMSDNKRKELKSLNIYTVEALASVDGVNLKTLGMGGRELKNIAQDFLDSNAPGDNTALLAKMAEMKAELDAFKAGATEGQKRTAIAVAEQDAVPPAPSSPAAMPDDVVIADLTEVTANFEGYTDEDIVNWLGDGGIKVDGRWGRPRLLAEAKTLLDQQGKKKG